MRKTAHPFYRELKIDEFDSPEHKEYARQVVLRSVYKDLAEITADGRTYVVRVGPWEEIEQQYSMINLRCHVFLTLNDPSEAEVYDAVSWTAIPLSLNHDRVLYARRYFRRGDGIWICEEKDVD